MLKKIIALSLILFSSYHAYPQDCFDKIAKQAVVIDSLQKVIKTEQENSQHYLLNCQIISTSFRDTIKTMKLDLSKLEKFKVDKKTIETQLNRKNDSIVLLKNQISEKNQQISIEKQRGEQKSYEEKEKGKNEALTDVINNYKNKKFDDLIMYSTKMSVQRDIQLVGNNMEVKPILSDLEKYFSAEELLTKKIDAVQLKNAEIQLNQIKKQSILLDALKDNIKYYKDFNDELKKTIQRLIDLDKRKVAAGEAEIQKLKFNDIVSELTDYIYNYYGYGNYPYLSNIVIEIIKRKKPNADANITDLLSRLQ